MTKLSPKTIQYIELCDCPIEDLSDEDIIKLGMFLIDDYKVDFIIDALCDFEDEALKAYVLAMMSGGKLAPQRISKKIAEYYLGLPEVEEAFDKVQRDKEDNAGRHMLADRIRDGFGND